jgi:16S rRNA processing protein RimM
MTTRGAGGERSLTVAELRFVGGRPVVGFAGFSRIEDVEALGGQELRVPEDALRSLPPGQFYHHELVGCAVETTAGVRVGEVERVEGGIGGSRLVVAGSHGEILIPLARAICTDIDVAARRIRIDPPDGLLDLNEVRHRDDLPSHGRGGARRGGGRAGH